MLYIGVMILSVCLQLEKITSSREVKLCWKSPLVHTALLRFGLSVYIKKNQAPKLSEFFQINSVKTSDFLTLTGSTSF